MLFSRFEKGTHFNLLAISNLSEHVDNCTLSVRECELPADPSNQESGCHKLIPPNPKVGIYRLLIFH
jgi:hypothetical protein